MELTYLSKRQGIGGKIKDCPEDFIVEEIMRDGTVLERDKKLEREPGAGDFTHFVLQKTNWNTLDVLRKIGKKLGCGLKSFGYAGTKDRNAVTTQLVSVYRQEIGSFRLKDVRILGSWKCDEKVSLGDLLGNRFTIRVNTGKRKTEDHIHSIYEEMDRLFPNYFGQQRFGIRENTHVVGKHMLQGSFRRACEEYLFGGKKENNADAREAREELKNSG
ncbi:MAG: tRNA pseudouridine(13) synthase TruD, partial [Candidatus Micrarchaeota archaeon]